MARILLAEDEASVREFIMRALTGVGHQVDAAGDGSDALARLGEMKAGGGSYDLLLTDILMPVMDVPTALARLEEFQAFCAKYLQESADGGQDGGDFGIMPVMDGISLALSASRDAPDMLIMLMTGYSDQRERAYGLDAIIQDILLKPFTLDELVTRIDTVLASRKRV